MVHHAWTVVCSRAIVDRETNNISIFNVIEQVIIRNHYRPDAALAIALEVVTLWTRSDVGQPCQELARLLWLSPSDETLREFEFDIDLQENSRNRSRVHFDNIPIGGEGNHSFRMELWSEEENDWEQVADVPLWIGFTPEDQEEAAAESED